MKRRMTHFDFHRYRATLRKLELVWILYCLGIVLLMLYWHDGMARHWRNNWGTLLVMAVTVIGLVGLSIGFRFLPFSPKVEQRVRERYRRKYPNECVCCGYNITGSPGPNCPECGDSLDGCGKPSTPVEA